MIGRSFALFAAKMLGYMLRLMLPYFLVRLFSVSDFGAYRQFFLVDATVKMLFQFGIAQSLYYFVPRDEKNAGAYLMNAIALNIAVFGAVYLAGYLARDWVIQRFNMPFLTEHYVVLACYTIVMAINVCLEAYLTARSLVRQAALFAVIGQVLVTIVTLATALIVRDLGSVFLAMTLAQLSLMVLQMIYIRRRLGGINITGFARGVILPQIRHGLLLGLGGGAWVMLTRTHEYYVTATRDVETFAVYSAGCTEIPVVQLYLQAIAAVTLGQFARLEQSSQWEAIRRLWRDVLRNLIGVTVPAVAFLLLISGPLIRFWFTPDYADAVDIFRIKTLVTLSMVWNAQLVLRAMDRNGLACWLNLGWLLASPLFYWAGDRMGGLEGIVWAQVAVMLGNRLTLQVALNRVAPVRFAYLASVREVVEFYGQIWHGGLQWTRRRLQR